MSMLGGTQSGMLGRNPQGVMQELLRLRDEQERQERERRLQGYQMQQRQSAYMPPPQQQQQSGGGMNPMQAYDMYQKFAGGAAPAASATGTGSVGAGTASAGGMTHAATGSGMVPVGGASGGGASGGGMLAGAGPWAALAAIIAANETYQNKQGNRPDDFTEQLQDMFTGKAFERDARKYGGDSGVGKAVRYAGRIGNPKGLYNALTDAGRWIGDLFS